MTTNVARSVLGIAIVLALPALGFSHPGHGNTDDGNSVLHYLGSPLHLLPLVLCVSVVAFMVILRMPVAARSMLEKGRNRG